MQLIDTHCHIHETSYPLDKQEAIDRAQTAGVSTMICVGTDQKSSQDAVAFTRDKPGLFASIGVHPHEAKDGWSVIDQLADENKVNVVAVGEIGLDYFYTHSPREVQIQALEAQIDTSLRHDLPIIFHVREAFDDFWPVFDNFHGIRGVLHSFTDTIEQMEAGLKRGLFIGVNGISTFTKDSAQQAMFRVIPLDKMLLETDAPFLTPVPLRGKVNEPAYLRNVAEFYARSRNTTLEELAAATTANAKHLFSL